MSFPNTPSHNLSTEDYLSQRVNKFSIRSDYNEDVISQDCRQPLENYEYHHDPSSSSWDYAAPQTKSLDSIVTDLAPEEVRWFYKSDGEKRWSEFSGYDSLRIEMKYREIFNPNDPYLKNFQNSAFSDSLSSYSQNIQSSNPYGPTSSHFGMSSIKFPTKSQATQPYNSMTSRFTDSHMPHKIVVRGGLYDINFETWKCASIYWPGEECLIIRGSWFYEGSWQPLEKEQSEVLEVKHLHMFKGHKLCEYTDNEVKGNVIHTETFPEFIVEWFSPNSIYLYSENKPSKIVRSVTTRLGFHKSTGYRLFRGYKSEASLDDRPDVEITHLVFVIHGIGQKMDTGRIIRNTSSLRDCVSWLKQKYFPNFPNHRAEFFPVEWRSNLQLDGDLVDTITPNTLASLRQMLNSSAMDIMYYTSPLYGGEVQRGLREELNRLYSMFSARNPYFMKNGGKVSVIAHSLGCVILYDIIMGLKPGSLVSSTQQGLLFQVENFFCLGSPLAVFLALRWKDTLTPEKMNVILPPQLCRRLYNMFHPTDPVAYRMEPLMSKDYSRIAPLVIQPYNATFHTPYSEIPIEILVPEQVKDSVAQNSGMNVSNLPREETSPGGTPRSPSKDRSWSIWGLMKGTKRNTDGSPLELIQGALEYRLDYILRGSNLGVSYLSALTSHTTYWGNNDVAYFVLTQIFPEFEKSASSNNPDRTFPDSRITSYQHNFSQDSHYSSSEYHTRPDFHSTPSSYETRSSFNTSAPLDQSHCSNIDQFGKYQEQFPERNQPIFPERVSSPNFVSTPPIFSQSAQSSFQSGHINMQQPQSSFQPGQFSMQPPPHSNIQQVSQSNFTQPNFSQSQPHNFTVPNFSQPPPANYSQSPNYSQQQNFPQTPQPTFSQTNDLQLQQTNFIPPQQNFSTTQQPQNYSHNQQPNYPPNQPPNLPLQQHQSNFTPPQPQPNIRQSIPPMQHPHNFHQSQNFQRPNQNFPQQNPSQYQQPQPQPSPQNLQTQQIISGLTKNIQSKTAFFDLKLSDGDKKPQNVNSPTKSTKSFFPSFNLSSLTSPVKNLSNSLSNISYQMSNMGSNKDIAGNVQQTSQSSRASSFLGGITQNRNTSQNNAPTQTQIQYNQVGQSLQGQVVQTSGQNKGNVTQYIGQNLQYQQIGSNQQQLIPGQVPIAQVQMGMSQVVQNDSLLGPGMVRGQTHMTLGQNQQMKNLSQTNVAQIGIRGNNPIQPGRATAVQSFGPLETPMGTVKAKNLRVVQPKVGTGLQSKLTSSIHLPGSGIIPLDNLSSTNILSNKNQTRCVSPLGQSKVICSGSSSLGRNMGSNALQSGGNLDSDFGLGARSLSYGNLRNSTLVSGSSSYGGLRTGVSTYNTQSYSGNSGLNRRTMSRPNLSSSGLSGPGYSNYSSAGSNLAMSSLVYNSPMTTGKNYLSRDFSGPSSR